MFVRRVICWCVNIFTYNFDRLHIKTQWILLVQLPLGLVLIFPLHFLLYLINSGRNTFWILFLAIILGIIIFGRLDIMQKWGICGLPRSHIIYIFIMVTKGCSPLLTWCVHTKTKLVYGLWWHRWECTYVHHSTGVKPSNTFISLVVHKNTLDILHKDLLLFQLVSDGNIFTLEMI